MKGNSLLPGWLQSAGKVLVGLLAITLLGGAVWLMLYKPSRDSPHQLQVLSKVVHNPTVTLHNAQRDVHDFVHRHRLTAPLVYLAMYVVLATLALPIWWLQFLAGIAFGLYEGTLLSVIGSTMAVTTAVAFIRWVASDWFHQRIESRVEQLKRFDDLLGHNGFLFVMTARLIPLIPFGLFNYALGLSKVSYRDIILGTFLGAIPLVAVHVALGVGYDPHDWGFDVVITALTLVLLTPLALRYLRPQWFKKIGVE